MSLSPLQANPTLPMVPHPEKVPVRRLAIRRRGRYEPSISRPKPFSSPRTLALDNHGPPPLPHEILQTIFVEAVRPSNADIRLAEKNLLRSTILACSQVCGLWRRAARGYSPLWVNAVDFQNHPPDVVEDLLTLSQPHLIVVGHRSAPLLIEKPEDLLSLLPLKPHRGRICEWNVVISSACRPLPNSRWIFGSIGCSSSRSIHTLRWSGTITSPTGALPAISSSLLKLELRNTNLALPHWMNLENLTELSVNSATPSTIKYSATEWFSVLRGTPRLRFLELNHAMKPHSPLDNTIGQPPEGVFLQALQLCSLAESSWDAAWLALVVFLVIDKPITCGLQLDLPPSVDLANEDGGGGSYSPGEVTQLLSLVAATLHKYDRLNLNPRPVATPRVEVSATYENLGIKVTFGTVPDPEATLNWNGDRGTAGVGDYLDSYFGSASHSSLPRHPPLSVTLRNPEMADIVNASILNSLSLTTCTSARITIDPKIPQSTHLDLASDAILASLSRMSEARTLVLNKGSLAALVPMLQEAVFMDDDDLPVPVLPKLKCVIVESTTSRADSGVVGDEVWDILLDYVEWRSRVGLPVTVSWCAREQDT